MIREHELRLERGLVEVVGEGGHERHLGQGRCECAKGRTEAERVGVVHDDGPDLARRGATCELDEVHRWRRPRLLRARDELNGGAEVARERVQHANRLDERHGVVACHRAPGAGAQARATVREVVGQLVEGLRRQSRARDDARRVIGREAAAQGIEHVRRERVDPRPREIEDGPREAEHEDGLGPGDDRQPLVRSGGRE